MITKEQLDAVYLERNQLVAALTKVYPASVEQHVDVEGQPWDDINFQVAYKRQDKMVETKITTLDLDLMENTFHLNNGYLRNASTGQYLHYTIGLRLFGEIPEGYQVDHIDRNRLNNSRWNLRLATRRGQSLNQTLQSRGYEKHGSKWRVYTQESGKKSIVASVSSEEEARLLSSDYMKIMREIAETDGTYIYPNRPFDNDWRNVIIVDLPTGQASWHVHDSEMELFQHLPRNQGRVWDGHSVEEKYARLRELPALTPDLEAEAFNHLDYDAGV